MYLQQVIICKSILACKEAMIGWCCNIKRAYQYTELPESHGVF